MKCIHVLIGAPVSNELNWWFHLCRFEMMLYKLEIMDHKTAERQGSLVPVLGAPIPIVLTKDVAIEVIFSPLCPLLCEVSF